jgi:hypothetical protein
MFCNKLLHIARQNEVGKRQETNQKKMSVKYLNSSKMMFPQEKEKNLIVKKRRIFFIFSSLYCTKANW